MSLQHGFLDGDGMSASVNQRVMWLGSSRTMLCFGKRRVCHHPDNETDTCDVNELVSVSNVDYDEHEVITCCVALVTDNV